MSTLPISVTNLFTTIANRISNYNTHNVTTDLTESIFSLVIRDQENHLDYVVRVIAQDSDNAICSLALHQGENVHVFVQRETSLTDLLLKYDQVYTQQSFQRSKLLLPLANNVFELVNTVQSVLVAVADQEYGEALLTIVEQVSTSLHEMLQGFDLQIELEVEGFIKAAYYLNDQPVTPEIVTGSPMVDVDGELRFIPVNMENIDTTDVRKQLCINKYDSYVQLVTQTTRIAELAGNDTVVDHYNIITLIVSRYLTGMLTN